MQIPLAMPEAAPVVEAKRRNEPTVMPVRRITVPVADEGEPTHRRWWVAIAPAAVILLAAIGWHEFHKPANEASQPITTLSESGQGSAQRAEQGQTQSAGQAQSATPAVPVQRAAPAGVDVPRWRVVAYTYNRQDQAQHKADQLAQKDAALRPEVFSPRGGAPYLVTLGGAMTRQDAAAFREKAAGEGLPRDIYIQNYEGRERRR
jgi:hypothetical protein